MRRYSYTLSESFWAKTELKWTTPDKMLPATVLYNDRFGGGYFSQFLIWWWAPTLAAVIFVAALPSVPYCKRLGARSAFATVAHQVIICHLPSISHCLSACRSTELSNLSLAPPACLQFKSAGSYQMYPRKFWMTVMGGLTVLEAFLLAIWITLNVVMLWNWYCYYTEPYDYGESMPLHKNQDKWQPMLKCQLHVEHHAQQRCTLTYCMLLLPLMLDSRCITITQYHQICKQAFRFVFSRHYHRQKCGCCSSKSDWHRLCHPKTTGES